MLKSKRGGHRAHRPVLATGIWRTGMSSAGSATYQICFRLPIPNPNPNPITDPNPKINKKQNDTGMKLNIELYLKVNFLGTGWVYNRPITGTGKETHMDIPVF